MKHLLALRNPETSRVQFHTCDRLPSDPRPGQGNDSVLIFVAVDDGRAREVERELRDLCQGYLDGDGYLLSDFELANLRLTYLTKSVLDIVERLNQALTPLPKRTKRRRRLMRAVTWLKEHDPRLTLPVRTVAKEVGVSPSTVQNAVTYLRAEQAERGD